MEAIVIFLALLIGYLLLRSRGGEGLDIRFKIAPGSTKEGTKDRVALGLAFATMMGGVVFVIVRRHGSFPYLIAGMSVAVLTLLFLYFKNRK